MTKSEKEKYELIEKFIEKNLSREEQEKFDFHLKTDMDFAKEVKAHMEVHELVLDQGIIEMKKKLREIHIAETKGNNNTSYKIFSALAIIFLLGGMMLYIFKTQGTPDEIEENRIKQVTIIDNDLNTDTNAHSKEISNHIIENATKVDKRKSTFLSNPENTATALKKDSSMNVLNSSNQYIPSLQLPKDTAVSSTGTLTNKSNPAKVDCSTIHITGEVTVKETCKDESTGSILIHLNSLKGGTKPIKFSITGDADFVTGSIFENLNEGHYNIYVRDANGCSNILKETKIATKDCPKDYLFYPDLGQEWTLPLKHNANAKLKIFNRAGALIYAINISNGYPNTWNGIDNSGQGLPMGNYSFVIVYDDQTISQGNVQILK
jgi:hypothetical protein